MNKSSMKCLFIHDHKFKKYKEKYFSEGKITDEVLSRYVLVGDSIVVLSRLEPVNNMANLSKITLENVTFKSIKGLAFSKAFSIYLFGNIRLTNASIKQADFLVVRTPSFLGIFTLLLNFIHHKKYFIEVVGDAQEALLTLKPETNMAFKAFTFVIERLNGYFITHADGVIYVTEASLQKKYPTNGISSYASNVEVLVVDKEITEDIYKVKKDIFKIGLIGSFNNHYKGLTEAISAISILNDSHKNIKLYILGSGSLEGYYKSLAKKMGVKDLVFFDGVLRGGEDVAKWLESLDLYIQPSYTEGLPRALIEAMSVGLPAIATDVGGIPELLSKDTLIKPYDSEALAKKMRDFIDSQQLRFEHGKLNYYKSKEYDQGILKQRRSDFWEAARNIVKKAQRKS